MTLSLGTIDVTSAIEDPRLGGAITFNVIRPGQSIDADGNATDAPTTFPNVKGSVTPDRARTLQRTGAGEKQVQSIRIITEFALSVGGAKTVEGIPDNLHSLDADIIQWNNGSYTVVAVQDWGQWGGGFYEVTADLLPYQLAVANGL